MKYDYILYTLPASMYSGKVRGYMNYKKLNHVDKTLNAYDLAIKIKSRTGEMVMPAVETRTGEWLQDTTLIIEELENRHPDHPIVVETPLQYTVSLLLEAWADEYWLPVAMHYRWSFKEENHHIPVEEIGDWLFPILPRFLRRKLGETFTRRLANAAPVIGFVPEQHQMLERWTERTLDLLEHHFSRYDYLLGGRPTIADYALLASFFGHLNRDPAPKRILMSSRENLTAWVERTHNGDHTNGELLGGDALPDTLMPVLQLVFEEFLPMVECYREVLKAYIDKHAIHSGDKIPRFLKKAELPMGDKVFRRQVMPYTLWMMQRVQKNFLQMSIEDQHKVDDWLEVTYGKKLSSLDLGPRLLRDGLSTMAA